ncbi:MAG: hypothetical protein QMD65_00930 [Patescibacteria group bacterium]|nr:hypothetical protein [Patescibacteria group bacterium]
MKIKDIILREIFNSRGEPVLEVGIEDSLGHKFIAQNPYGVSRGRNEALVFSYERAKKVLNGGLAREIVKKSFGSVRSFDHLLFNFDGTCQKEKIGGNLALGLSVAFARGLAYERGQVLWELLNEEFFSSRPFRNHPLIFSNLINGGAHANNNLDFQEYMVVVKITGSVRDTVEKLINFYKRLGSLLEKKFKKNGLIIGDEGGYSLEFENNFEPITILESFIEKERLVGKYSIGLDIAASNFYSNGRYSFEGKRISKKDLYNQYVEYFKKSKFLFSIEDPFEERDIQSFKDLASELNDKLTIGDDLTATNPVAILALSKAKVINGVIIKPNQIGTVTESCEAVRVAHENGVRCIISHRSGETEDNFIINLARASGADGVKIGAPIRERLSKFNELIRVYDR